MNRQMSAPAHRRALRMGALLTSVTITAAIALIATPAIAETPGSNDPTDRGMDNVIEEFPGDLEGPYVEQYLLDETDSHAETETPHIASWPSGDWTPHPYATKRWADGHGWFTYRLPVDPAREAPLRLTMVTKGELQVEADGQVLLHTGNSGEGDYTPRELLLTDPSMWSDGAVDVRFSDADPGDGWGPNLYSLELGETSTLRERLKALDIGSEIVWNHGLPDGTANEFRGLTSDITVGDPWEDGARDGALTLRWNQQIEQGVRYILHVGVIGRTAGGWNHVTGTQSLDLGADGSAEVSTAVGGEKVMDIDVTDRLQSTGNAVRVIMPAGARLDFATLLAVPEEPTPLGELPVSFGGNEIAEDFTRLIDTSWHFTLTMLNDKNSGFIDSSMLNGAFANTLFIADFGPALLEMFHEGHYDRAREAVEYAVPDSTGHYEQDIAAGNDIFVTMLGLLKVDGYSNSSKDLYWPRVAAGMDRLRASIDETPLHLVDGTNWETSGESRGLYASATSYYTLLAAAEAADRLGESSTATLWRDAASTLAEGIETNLVWPAGATWLGHPMPEGTWRYGRTDEGGDPGSARAGWHAIGSAKDLYYGLLGDDPAWRARTDATLDAHMDAFWPDWRTVGNNKGFGTDYGVLSERGGWPLNSLLEGDRIGDATKNIGHIVFNSTDRNFAPFGENTAIGDDNAADYSEWSPHLIIRETDALDRGSSASVGNGPGSEDLNLVEYILFLKNARIIAGVDDQLHDTANLRIAPRLPWTWTSAQINDRPVAFRADDGSYATTTLDYDLTRSDTAATMTVGTADPVPGAEVRLGPFPLNATEAEVAVDGIPVAAELERSGDAKWATVSTDLGPLTTTVTADVHDPSEALRPGLDSTAGLTATAGSWNASDGVLTGDAVSGDAWVLMDASVSGDGAVRADVVLDDGNAVGVSTRMASDGSAGYDLIVDRVDGKVKIAKRPYAVLASAPMPVARDRSYRLELRVVGEELTAFVDGVKVLHTADSTYTSGRSGVFAYKSSSQFRNIVTFE